MALTINNFVGWETGGLEEIDGDSPGTKASVGMASPAPKSGTYRLQIATGPGSLSSLHMFQPGSGDAGNDYVCGFWFQAADVTAYQQIWASRGDTAGFGLDISIFVNGSGILELADTNGAVVGTGSTSLSNDTWHCIEIYWQHSNTGNAEVFLDGVQEISVTSKDFIADDSNAIDEVCWGDPAGLIEPVYYDGIYVMSGASSAADRLGEFEVLGPYQNTVEDATDVGDALNVGTWADVGETPLNETNTASYTGTPLSGGTTCDEGARAGPSGDPDVDGDDNIKAAKWIFRVKRGTGAESTHEIRIGNDGDGMTNFGVTLTADFADYFRISEAASIVPLSTEHVQHGLAVDGAQDLICAEIWSTILHVPSLDDEEGAYNVII